MTNRVGLLSEVWAQNGVATDPDLDTKHPIFQAGKFMKGWIVEKEPHQWQNFLYQITDLKMQFTASEQIQGWDDSISYLPNALTRYSDVVYVNYSGAISVGKSPKATPSIWSPVLSDTSNGVNSSRNTLQTKYDVHINADNPHNDSIHKIGGYEKTEVDDFLGSETDPRTIVYHEQQTGGTVHGETPAQVGTLPDTGGHFTGDVGFLGGLTIGGGNIRQDGPDMKFGHAGGSIILESDGDSVYGEDATGKRGEITTKANFERQQQSVNYMFALPPPITEVDFRSAWSGGILNGGYYIESATEPKLSSKGWEIEDGFTIYGLEYYFDRTDYIEYWAGDVFKRITTESTVTVVGGVDFKAIMARIAPDATHVTRIAVYEKLNEYQKSTLLLTS